MAIDNQLAFRNSTALVGPGAANYDGTAINIPGGLAESTMWILFIYWAALVSTSTGTLTAYARASADNSTYNTITDGTSKQVALGTAAVSGRIWLPITDAGPWFNARITLAGTNPQTKWMAFLVDRPT